MSAYLTRPPPPFTFSDPSLRFAPAFAPGETPFRMTACCFFRTDTPPSDAAQASPPATPAAQAQTPALHRLWGKAACLGDTGRASSSAMPRATATTAKPLSLAERKARLASMVGKGQISAKRAALIDFREPTAAVRAEAKKLVPMAKRALARVAREREQAAA